MVGGDHNTSKMFPCFGSFAWSVMHMYVHKMAKKAPVYIMYCRKFLPLIAVIGGDKQLLTMHTSLRSQDMYTMYNVHVALDIWQSCIYNIPC